ncbi:hypothetical protein F8388_013318 [Cannabis sativa]|uniref:4Fe-4S ferredoxin-type domain-containing protein n=1 Tax=Cannabis sativa TaxID=3483 RepID=A0A7J6I602_CANSA|nr:hypothetical protein F8388_013318 [Cannabis sativa]KAF4402448.1 hypothetical protein G4B88_012233 [Cannabis sativa]
MKPLHQTFENIPSWPMVAKPEGFNPYIITRLVLNQTEACCWKYCYQTIAAAEAAIGPTIVSSIYRCTQCVRACPTDVLEMIPWDGCKAKKIASAPRTEDCVGCKICESACPTS